MIAKYFYISLIDIIKKISAAKLNENLLNEYLFFIVVRESCYSFTLKSEFLTTHCVTKSNK